MTSFIAPGYTSSGRAAERGGVLSVYAGPLVRDRDKRTMFCVDDPPTPEAIRETGARSNLPSVGSRR